MRGFYFSGRFASLSADNGTSAGAGSVGTATTETAAAPPAGPYLYPAPPADFPFPVGNPTLIENPADGSVPFHLSDFGRLNPTDPRPVPPTKRDGFKFGAHRAYVADRFASHADYRTGRRVFVYVARTGFFPDGSPSGLTSYHPVFRFPTAVIPGILAGAYGHLRYFIGASDGSDSGPGATGFDPVAIAEPDPADFDGNGTIPAGSVVILRGATDDALRSEINRSHPGFRRGSHGVYYRVSPVALSVIPTRPTKTAPPADTETAPTDPAAETAPTQPTDAPPADAPAVQPETGPETGATAPETADQPAAGSEPVADVPTAETAVNAESGPVAETLPDVSHDSDPVAGVPTETPTVEPVAEPTRKHRKTRGRKN